MSKRLRRKEDDVQKEGAKIRKMERMGLVKVYGTEMSTTEDQKLASKQQIAANYETIMRMERGDYEVPFDKESEGDYYDFGQCLSYHNQQIWRILKQPAGSEEFQWVCLNEFLKHEPLMTEKYEPLLMAVIRKLLGIVRDEPLEIHVKLSIMSGLPAAQKLTPTSALWYQILNHNGRQVNQYIFGDSLLYQSPSVLNALFIFARGSSLKCHLLRTQITSVTNVDAGELEYITRNNTLSTNAYHFIDLGLFCHHQLCMKMVSTKICHFISYLKQSEKFVTEYNKSLARQKLDLEVEIASLKNKIRHLREKARRLNEEDTDEISTLADRLNEVLIKNCAEDRTLQQTIRERAEWFMSLINEMVESILPKLERVVGVAMQTPPSLKQLTRLVIRDSMRDIDIIEDCYKLPLYQHNGGNQSAVDRELQDYVCMRSLRAPISEFYLRYEPRYNDYDVAREVQHRYIHLDDREKSIDVTNLKYLVL